MIKFLMREIKAMENDLPSVKQKNKSKLIYDHYLKFLHKQNLINTNIFKFKLIKIHNKVKLLNKEIHMIVHHN